MADGRDGCAEAQTPDRPVTRGARPKARPAARLSIQRLFIGHRRFAAALFLSPRRSEAVLDARGGGLHVRQHTHIDSATLIRELRRSDDALLMDMLGEPCILAITARPSTGSPSAFDGSGPCNPRLHPNLTPWLKLPAVKACSCHASLVSWPTGIAQLASFSVVWAGPQ